MKKTDELVRKYMKVCDSSEIRYTKKRLCKILAIEKLVAGSNGHTLILKPSNRLTIINAYLFGIKVWQQVTEEQSGENAPFPINPYLRRF